MEQRVGQMAIGSYLGTKLGEVPPNGATLIVVSRRRIPVLEWQYEVPGPCIICGRPTEGGLAFFPRDGDGSWDVYCCGWYTACGVTLYSLNSGGTNYDAFWKAKPSPQSFDEAVSRARELFDTQLGVPCPKCGEIAWAHCYKCGSCPSSHAEVDEGRTDELYRWRCACGGTGYRTRGRLY